MKADTKKSRCGRLDRPEVRPGTNLNKAILVYFSDPESGTHTEPNCLWPDPGEALSQMDEMFVAPQQEHGCCKDRETTTSHLGTEIISGVFLMDTEEVGECSEESDVPQILLQARQAYRQSNYREVRNELKDVMCRKRTVSCKGTKGKERDRTPGLCSGPR